MDKHRVEKPTPLKVYGRHHYACTRCKVSKIKCSGEKPACSNCRNIGKPDSCKYPTKDRKIVIMESDLNKLHEKVQQLESQLASSSSSGSSGSPGSSGSSSSSELSGSSELVHPFTIRKNLKFFFENEYENYEIQYNLVKDSLKLIPNKSYCSSLIEKVYYSYNQEFYLIDKQEIQPLIDAIHELSHELTNPNYIPKFTQISLCYFFILLAFGEQLLNPSIATNTNSNTNGNGYPGIIYYQYAEHLFRLTRPNMCMKFIQSGLLLGLYSANFARYSTVYNFFGIATRSAINQGYHRIQEFPEPFMTNNFNKNTSTTTTTTNNNNNSGNNTTIHQLKILYEKMKRLWWTVFVIDTTWSTKSIHVQYTDTDVNLPCENIYHLEGEDNLDLNTLELNVHLTKYVAKFIRVIYGPNIRTFSIKYINTNQFNQNQLLTNILNSSAELIEQFELPYLSQFKSIDYISDSTRILANLFLRYHHLIITITKPLLSLIIHSNSPTIVANHSKITQLISKGIFCSCATIDIITRLFLRNKIFILGYWDSQHLFTGLLFLIICYLDNRINYPIQLNNGIRLLQKMAGFGNINARLRIEQIFKLLHVLKIKRNLLIPLQENIIFDDCIDHYKVKEDEEVEGNHDELTNGGGLENYNFTNSIPKEINQSGNQYINGGGGGKNMKDEVLDVNDYTYYYYQYYNPINSISYLPRSYTKTLLGIDKFTNNIINTTNDTENTNRDSGQGGKFDEDGNIDDKNKNYRDFYICLIDFIQRWDN